MTKLFDVLRSKANRGLALVLVIVLILMDMCPVYAQNVASETEAETEIETEIETEDETEIETEAETQIETEAETQIETEVETETEAAIMMAAADDEEEEIYFELTKDNLSNSDNYKAGWYKSWGGQYEITKSSICSTNYYIATEDTYNININDARIKLQISEYDANKRWLKYTGGIFNGATFTKQPKTEYIMVAVSSTVWGVDLVGLMNNGLEIEIVSPKDEIEEIDESDTTILTKNNLSNPDNYMSGWYKSWGGTYEDSTSSICSTDYYKATEDTYYIKINDSRIKLQISEYNADKKWLKYTGGVFDGATFTKQPKTEYIMIAISSTVWGVSPLSLLNDGLEIEFSTNPSDNLESDDAVDIADADFTNLDNWISGIYVSTTGGHGVDSTKICYASYLKVESTKYIVNLPDGYLKMNIVELDDEGKVVSSTNLTCGQKWEKSETTSRIGITIASSNSSVSYTTDEYKQMIKNYPQTGLIKYQAAYNASGDMKELTAFEFVKAMNVGWNLGNSLDSKGSATKRGEDSQLNQELNWGNPYVSKSLIDYVAQCGFNTIRIPVTWYYNTYTDSDGNLRVREKWLERVQEVVDYAMDNGMYVIINSHHDQPILYAGTSDEEFAQVLLDAENLWLDIADYFKDYDEHLIFESYNEIDNVAKSWNYSDTAAEQMNQLNQVFVNTVRGTGSNNANRILMVPTLLDGHGEDYYNAFVLPTDTAIDRLVVTVHNYPSAFNQDLEGYFIRLEQFSDTINAPIIVGEFGTTTSYALPEFRPAQASNYVARAAEHGIKCIWWDNGSNYAIINRNVLSESNATMINALMEGANGIAYEVTDEIIFDDISNFSLVMPNLSTGGLSTTYWGTITTTPNYGAIPVTAGEMCMINLTTLGDASDIWLQRILFYDADGNYLSGKELQKRTYIFEVPENAAFMRISANSAYRSIKLAQYAEYFEKGDLRLGISMPNSSNVKAVQLTIK